MLAGFAAISFAIIIVPGPSVMFVVGQALSAGRRVALLSVLGNALGVFVQVLLVALGLGLLVSGSSTIGLMLRLAGGSYLVWLGVRAIRTRHAPVDLAIPGAERLTAPLRDGFVVGLANPKSVVFLAALLPRFVDADVGSPAAQMVFLGATFCVMAVVGDGCWALVAAQARAWFAGDGSRLASLRLAGGLVLVALGLLVVVL
jgi:threonine/homoserine/homoserine lactone efflux protein